VLAFWKNSERNLERLSGRFGLSDETKSLSPNDREHVQAFIAAMRKNYGIEARVLITREPSTPPEADGKTLYVGLCPDEKLAVVQLPPLVARALGARGLTVAGAKFSHHPLDLFAAEARRIFELTPSAAGAVVRALKEEPGERCAREG